MDSPTRFDERPDIPAPEPPPESVPAPRLPLEIGIVIAGRIDPADMDAVRRSRTQLQSRLARDFPQFDWRLALVQRIELVSATREEPMLLLQAGVDERDLQHWDFVLVVTSADLISHYKPVSLAAVARAYDAAVLSTARIDPQAVDASALHADRVEVMSRRLLGLMLHAFGHLNGLMHTDEPSLMADVESVEQIDPDRDWSPDDREFMLRSLHQTADLRVEEQVGSGRASPLRFYLRSIAANSREILNAIREAQPWKFPLRLSRFTTAAVSALVVLMLTAESWDLAERTRWQALAGLTLLSVLGTTVYVVIRQQLLIRRRSLLSEQTVVTNISTIGIVLTGMLLMYVLLFGASLAAGIVLFPESLIEDWAALESVRVHVGHYVRMAAFASSVGIVIGALGVSFEDQQHFRHIIFVDEET